MNQRSQDYGRSSRQTEHTNYHRGCGTEATSSPHSANLAQDNHSSAEDDCFSAKDRIMNDPHMDQDVNNNLCALVFIIN
ncbi:hypothetical protein H5410_033338 [Solanum commersonii]|uniref:Uncharacterized protein n=1 Tax=Solanum commersonii TaxID=4109 RepID=A0A9J5YQH2_SOLCO|nr:hypothetical protein H5410_033338 [Solanum commersonii]